MNSLYAFTENADINDIKESAAYKALKEAEAGDLKPLKSMYTSGYVFGSEHLKNGSYRLMGWVFDFTPYCKRYLVNVKYYGWQEYKTPNKTCLYNLIGRHNVIEILEINKKGDE